MANSVLSALDIEDEVCEIRLLVSGYRSGGEFLVLVEGINDVIVYEKFFSKDKVEVHCTSGCYKLTEIVQRLDEEHLEDYFIGIKDADYDVLNHVSYSYSNLFLTDKHDLETMMISDGMLENIMKEYLSYEDMKRNKMEVQPQSVLSEAIKLLHCMSYIRWYNSQNEDKLDFGNVRLSTLMKLDRSLSYGSCISFMKKLPQNASMSLTERDMLEFESCVAGEIDDMMLLRGHDLCEMISLLIMEHPYYRRRTNVNADKVEAALRLSYGMDCFKKTALYNDMSTWFAKHEYEGLLAC